MELYILKSGIFTRFVRVAFPTHYNDWILRPKRLQFTGAQPDTKKVAIFLIFSTCGIQDSHIHSLHYMVENGYSPFVVSNSPLSDIDMAKLKPISWRIMVRQNFGYDFGGYRDAILDLAPQLYDKSNIVLFNDSNWFPIPGKMNWLQTAEQTPADFVGATLSGFTGKLRLHNFANNIWNFRTSARNFHYGSFAIMIKNNILKTKDFQIFWQRLRLSQGKARTVKRGERGLTKWAIKLHHSHAATSDHRDFDTYLTKLPLAERRHMLKNIMVSQDGKAESFLQEFNIRAECDEMDMDRVDAIIRTIVGRRGLAATLPQVLIRDFNYAFLKKYPAKEKLFSRDMMAHIVRDLPEPIKSIIQKEAGFQK